MTRTQKRIRRIVQELLLLSLYLVILKATGCLTRNWLFALAPAIFVFIVKAASIIILFIEYIIQSHKYGK